MSGSRLEIYKTNNYSIITGKRTNNANGRNGKTNLNEQVKQDNKIRARRTNLNKAKNNIIRLIKCNPDMDIFITLTFREKEDYTTSKKHLNNFFNKLRKVQKSLKYIWILEFGTKNKRIHYHVLTNIKIPAKIIFAGTNKKKSVTHKRFENVFAQKFWKQGFVDIRRLDKNSNSNVALYVSCYITKDLLNQTLNGYRIYGYSKKTLKKPIIKTMYEDIPIEELLEDLKMFYEITYTNSYDIGYTTKEGFERKGIMTYVDLKSK